MLEATGWRGAALSHLKILQKVILVILRRYWKLERNSRCFNGDKKQLNFALPQFLEILISNETYFFDNWLQICFSSKYGVDLDSRTPYYRNNIKYV